MLKFFYIDKFLEIIVYVNDDKWREIIASVDVEIFWY